MISVKIIISGLVLFIIGFLFCPADDDKRNKYKNTTAVASEIGGLGILLMIAGLVFLVWEI